ncbi:MlaE family ABC transporter permease [Stutzerimonas tarimensis]|uniref:MlaE family ABC transporter permease n=1 Tax=Stutzerimonas tarimensis TaxID=1507735 RepID=A0ABV7T8D8_9GAMM
MTVQGRTTAQLGWMDDQDGMAVLQLSGTWTLRAEKPELLDIWRSRARPPGTVLLQIESLDDWDSSLLALLRRLQKLAGSSGSELRYGNLPEGVERLLRMADESPKRPEGAPRPRYGRVSRVGLKAIGVRDALVNASQFVGEVLLGLGRLFSGRSRMRRSDFLLALAQCGPGALPIVGLIATLVGLILAFVGAAQLQAFGAQLYIANMVAIGMTREMGALMTAVILAGRTGAAYAAELGSMQANEEIDALRTFGFPPLDFLVLPRLLALLIALPLLTVFADALGILGGFIIGAGLFDISAPLYISQSLEMLTMTDFLLGLFKSLVFAVLIGLIGCYYGLSCGRNAQAVGQATTRAVVSIIVALVISDALITLICTQLGI